MKKVTMTLVVAAFMLSATNTMAQDKKAATKTVQTAENKQKEADALQHRIEQYTEKVEANKDKVDYAAEQTRITEMKTKWETLSGKTWKEAPEKKTTGTEKTEKEK